MNQLEGLLILLGLPAALLLNGYWLAALLAGEDRVDRLAYGVATGLAVLLFAVAAVSFAHPLSGIWAWVCLTPILLTLALPRSRRALVQDLVGVVRDSPRVALLAGAGFAVLLLWPVIVDPAALFYDGTSNHDSFFWIADAEHLRRHSYMERPEVSMVRPLTNTADAIVGWKPSWGRMGAEGVLALASSVIGLSPFKLYLYGTASLAIVWCALAGLILRTFVNAKPSPLTSAVVMGLQPLFIFFYGNSNLPNLLGTLCGTAAIVATERALRAGLERRGEFTAWSALAALSLHGLICSYPEMIPFILLPCGLLWLRPWFTGSARWTTRLAVLAVLLAGLVLNPATAIRGYNGFLASFASARADTAWANLFAPLKVVEYVPALITLSVPGAKELDWWFGPPLSLVIIVAFGFAVVRSRDHWGLLAGLSGGAVLLAYTIVTGFSYGWQKTTQFAGLFIAVIPAAIIDTLWHANPTSTWWRRLRVLSLAGLVTFMGYATIMNCRDIYKWSDRKVISNDWFALRDLSRSTLRDAPILVDAATFRMAFFHGMWAAYFLPESDLYFGGRGEESGGYLRAYVVNEAKTTIPTPKAVLVGRLWADTFDANSERLLTGREYALVTRSNRVITMSGTRPGNGPPDHVTGDFSIELLPHSASVLVMELAPLSAAGWPAGEWRARRVAAGVPDQTVMANGASPWTLRIPLVAGKSNNVTVALAGAEDPDALSFVVRQLRIENQP